MKKAKNMGLLVLLAALIFNMTAVAAEARASQYFNEYYCGISTDGGKIKFDLTVSGRSVMSKIGASSIAIYKSDGSYVTTLYASSKGNEEMMSSNTRFHYGSASYSGQAGVTYYAIITFYASNSSGSDSVPYRTENFTA